MRSLIVAGVLLSATVRADDVAQARAEYKQATTDYALGNYAQAAAHYERAFALTQDPPMLYNAAQAYRLGGNKPRALELYQNYLRVFGNRVPNREEVRTHIANLKAALAHERTALNQPPTAPRVVPLPEPPKPEKPKTAVVTPKPAVEKPKPAAETPKPAAEKPKPAETPAPAVAPILVEAAPKAEKPKSRLWAVGVGVGAAAVVVLAVGLGVGLGAQPSDPQPSFGVAAVR